MRLGLLITACVLVLAAGGREAGAAFTVTWVDVDPDGTGVLEPSGLPNGTATLETIDVAAYATTTGGSPSQDLEVTVTTDAVDGSGGHVSAHHTARNGSDDGTLGPASYPQDMMLADASAHTSLPDFAAAGDHRSQVITFLGVEPPESIQVYVDVSDYAPYGEFVVTVDDIIAGESYECIKEIPYDELPMVSNGPNGNRIADAFDEIALGLGMEIDPDADNETLPGGVGTARGDGLSYFEEYRGFRTSPTGTNNVYTKGAPHQFDLFAFSTSDVGLGEAGAISTAFDLSAHTVIHRINGLQMDGLDTRVINAKCYHAVTLELTPGHQDQYGFMIYDWYEERDEDGEPITAFGGTTMNPSAGADGSGGNPSTAQQTLIYVKIHEREFPDAGERAAAMAKTVAHEVGHSVGLGHVDVTYDVNGNLSDPMAGAGGVQDFMWTLFKSGDGGSKLQWQGAYDVKHLSEYQLH